MSTWGYHYQDDQEERIHRMRLLLLADYPFYGALALHLRLTRDDAGQRTRTMGTDGTILAYYPPWVKQLTDREIMSILAHEVSHCARLHPWRMGSRDPARWNLAADHDVNRELLDAGFTLPASLIRPDPRFKGMAVEQIYPLVTVDPSGPPQPDFWAPDPGDGTPSPSAPDATPDPGSTGQQDPPMTALDWQIAAEQAAQLTRRVGMMPGGEDLAIKAARRSRTDWRAELAAFIDRTIPRDWSWSRPNRRYLATGLYLPSPVRENMPRLGVALDTSGSISSRERDTFGAEIAALFYQVHPIALDVLYADSNVQGHETFTPDDPEVVLRPKGGGGTRFQPALDWFSQAEEPPAAVIYLTDLDGPVPTEPAYPVLWVTPEHVTRIGPFGQTIRLTLYDD